MRSDGRGVWLNLTFVRLIRTHIIDAPGKGYTDKKA